MIETNNKQALKELNKVVRVFGVDKSFKKTAEVFSKIEKKYKLYENDRYAKNKGVKVKTAKRRRYYSGT